VAKSILRGARGPQNLNLVPYLDAYWQWERQHARDNQQSDDSTDDDVEFLCHIIHDVALTDVVPATCPDAACSLHATPQGFGDWRAPVHFSRPGIFFPGAQSY
jgi:hypothetical protein